MVFQAEKQYSWIAYLKKGMWSWRDSTASPLQTY